MLVVRDIARGASRVGLMLTGEARSLVNSLAPGVSLPSWVGDAKACRLLRVLPLYFWSSVLNVFIGSQKVA